MLRLPAFVDILVRAAVAAAWLGCFAWFALMVAGYGFAAYEKILHSGSGDPGQWVRVPGQVERVTREQGRAWGMDKVREVVAYTYVVEGVRYRGLSENVGWSSESVSGAERGMPATARYSAGAPLDVWASRSSLEQSQLAEPRELGSPWPDLGRSLAYAMALVVVTLVAKAIVLRKPPRLAEVLDVGPVREVRETVEEVRGHAARMNRFVQSEIPEPEDVPLPKSIRIEPMPSGVRVEFPVLERSAREVFGWLVGGLFGVTFTWIGATARAGEGGWIAIAFGLACVFFFLLEFRRAYRRCVVEVSRAGLAYRKGYLSLGTGTFVDRREIDFVETRPNVATGHPGAFTTYFEIAMIRRDGKRIVLGENVPGIAFADTLVRRIGRELGLHPEQVLNTAATMRRTVAPLSGIFTRKDRAG